MSGSASAISTPVPATPMTPDEAIASMKDAFNAAISTNAEITNIKTVMGATETATQQRPNIG